MALLEFDSVLDMQAMGNLAGCFGIESSVVYINVANLQQFPHGL